MSESEKYPSFIKLSTFLERAKSPGYEWQISDEIMEVLKQLDQRGFAFRAMSTTGEYFECALKYEAEK